MHEKIDNKHIEKIDALRGIAILSVFFYHCQLIFFSDFQQGKYVRGFLQLDSLKDFLIKFNPFAYGYTGVHLFLIISGFVIHLSYLKSKKSFSAIHFFKRRFWRIYPPYLIVLLFICFTRIGFGYYLFSSEGKQTLLYHLLLIHNFSSRDFFFINPSFWSLALEVQLYLIYPVFLILRKKIGIAYSFLIVLFIAIILFGFGLVYPETGKNYVYSTSVLQLWFLWCGGAFLAENFLTNKSVFNAYNPFLIIIAFLLLIFSKFISVLFVFSIFFSAFFWILFFEYFLNSVQLRNNMLYFKPLMTLGLCSYSFYLIHQPYLGQLINYFAIFTNTGHTRFLNIIPAGIILSLIAYSMYNLIELFFMKISKKI